MQKMTVCFVGLMLFYRSPIFSIENLQITLLDKQLVVKQVVDKDGKLDLVDIEKV